VGRGHSEPAAITFGPEPVPIRPSTLPFRDVGGETIASTAGLLG
jgi:hypothetical protein